MRKRRAPNLKEMAAGPSASEIACFSPDGVRLLCVQRSQGAPDGAQGVERRLEDSQAADAATTGAGAERGREGEHESAGHAAGAGDDNAAEAASYAETSGSGLRRSQAGAAAIAGTGLRGGGAGTALAATTMPYTSSVTLNQAPRAPTYGYQWDVARSDASEAAHSRPKTVPRLASLMYA